MIDNTLWLDILSRSEKNLLQTILDKVKEDGQNNFIFPSARHIFRALKIYPNIKVVVLGQDPYPTAGFANGYAFAVNLGIPIPASLRNIFKELKEDIGDYQTDKTLQHWVNQGVLLLNTILTVQEGKPSSHSEIGWKKITNRVIKHISDEFSDIVFILWGNYSREKKHLIDDTRHLIIESAHPSPLSASRGFFGSKPFSRTNQWLEDHSLDIINW